MIGHTFEEATEKSSWIASMIQWRKDSSPNAYMQIPRIEAFFDEVARNEIENVVLKIYENA